MFPEAQDFYVYDAEGRQHEYADQKFLARKFGINSEADASENVRRLNDLIEYASERSSSRNLKTCVEFLPEDGIINLAGKVVLRNNISLLIRNHLRYVGDDRNGHFIQVTPPVDFRGPGAIQNVEIGGGGIIDSNEILNTNGIAIGNRDNGNENGATNIWIHDITLCNSKHGSRNHKNDSELSNLGRGGGKGLTIQFGVKNVLAERVRAYQCDIGLSIEGKHTSNGYVRDVTIDRFDASYCRYSAAYLSGSYAAKTYGLASSANIRNFRARKCGLEKLYGSEHYVSEHVGVITCSSASNIYFHGILDGRSSDRFASMSAIRGSHRDCDFHLSVISGKIRSLVNSIPADMHGQSQSGSKENTYNIDINFYESNKTPITESLFIESNQFGIGKSESNINIYSNASTAEYIRSRISGSASLKVSGRIILHGRGEILKLQPKRD